MTAKEAREIVAEYKRHGFLVEKSKHVKIFSPSGQLITVLPSSRCGGRADQNAKAALRRAIRQRQAQAA